MGWKTISGALLAALGYLTQAEVIAGLPPKVGSVLAAIGLVLGAVGARHAIAKGPGKSG